MATCGSRASRPGEGPDGSHISARRRQAERADQWAQDALQVVLPLRLGTPDLGDDEPVTFGVHHVGHEPIGRATRVHHGLAYGGVELVELRLGGRGDGELHKNGHGPILVDCVGPRQGVKLLAGTVVRRSRQNQFWEADKCWHLAALTVLVHEDVTASSPYAVPWGPSGAPR